jgi:hypothetical protein
VNLSGYIRYRRDRQDERRGGGVVCYIRNNLPCLHLKHLEDDDIESMWFSYRACTMPRLMSHIVVGVIYHPPRSESNCVISHILQCLDDITCSHLNAGIVLLGDFNNLNDTSIISLPLKQVLKLFTGRGKNFVKIHTNVHTWYQQPTVTVQPAICKSDHNAVIFQLNTGYDCKRVGDQIKMSLVLSRLVRSRDSNRKALLAQAFRNFNLKSLYV